ncbi:hypothetical protein LWC34_20175 [Kibdelosporangium philippinense]|uniref:Small secreted domain n=1 Tax=Kibdelosporangium philippinense TaxID=211113 RepID=A0ABS8ZEK2_9PSEU|nr:hypothetical protein [Kibdelosporangium philippinense]MCE7005126.1 hypothetical protein [Kibdelosporangium philippinense]
MQTWARRGLQTALITGGLLMLGTGIASANENVNPDRPASPLDPQVKIPVRVHDNAIGTPFGQKNLPDVNRDVVVSPGSLTKGLPAAKATPVVDKAQSVAGKLPGAGRVTHKSADVFHGNVVSPHIIAPVEFAGNAIAAGGDAHVNATSSETDTNYSPIWTDGSDSALAGNVVNLDWALPIRVSGNAVAALGKATTHFVSENTTISGGDIVTSGANSVLGGNVVSGQFATPVGVTGNAASLGGIAKAVTEMDDEAHAPGTIKTNGDNSVVGGTGAGAPIALPVGVHGNAAAAGGKSWVDEKNTLVATAGQSLGQQADYIKTSGTESVVGGTVIESAVSTTADVTCNAANLAGGTGCVGETDSITKAGGSTATNGDKSVIGGTGITPAFAGPIQVFANADTLGGLASATHKNTDVAKAGGNTVTSGKEAVAAGTIADPAVSAPVEMFGTASNMVGISKANSLNDIISKAGGNSYSNADKSVASGTTAGPAVALPAEVFGLAAALGGQAEALAGEHKISTAGGESVVHADESVLGATTARPAVAGPVQVISNSATLLGRGNADVCNDVITTAGGYTGTTGNDSFGGGNAVTPAVGLPGEVFSNNANLGGLTSSKLDENKVTTAGGTTNTNDDAGVLASNAVVASVAGPVQVFGNAATGGGISKATAIKKTIVKSGGEAHAKGTGGAGSGNVAAVPVALPTQVYGAAAGVLGKATAWAEGDTSSTSGGMIFTDGQAGTVNGNVASVPLAGAAQVFGDAAGVASIVNATGENTTDATSGGDVTTNGDDGSISGNVASVQPVPVAQVFGNAAALAGLVNGTGNNDTMVTNGGDITTSGDRGSISGNLADVPVAALAGVFGNAAAAGGNAIGVGPNETTAVTGGDDVTSGKGGNLSGNLATVPAVAIAQVFGNAASVVGNAVGVAPNDTTALVGGDAETNGEFGSMSGNLFAVPVAAVAQVFGNAASVGGHAIGIADNNTTALVGGEYDTEGPKHTLSGVQKVVPLGAVVQVFDIPVPVLAHAIAHGTNNTLVKVDDTAPIIDLPIGGGGLAAHKLPRLPKRGVFPHKQSRADLPVETPGMSDVDVAGLPGGVAAPGINVVPNLGGSTLNGVKMPTTQDLTSGKVLSNDVTQTLPMMKATELLPVQPSLPIGQSRSDLPVQTPGLSGVDVAGLPGGVAAPGINVVPNLGGSTLNGVKMPTTQDLTSGKVLSNDVTQTLPMMKATELLPVQPSTSSLPSLPKL